MSKKPSNAAAASGSISLKKIVAEIEKVLREIDKRPSPRSVAATSNLARTKLALRAARDAVESACTPGFNVP